jgi:hypothetical protein
MGRAAAWAPCHYRDRIGDPTLETRRLPPTICQSRDAFVRTDDAKAYKLALQRKAGLPVVGRPPLAAVETTR